jgi:nucleotide-binding universal stress UspA family protein
MVKNILVPYDGSESSKRALEFALDLANLYHASISIVSCLLIHPHVDPVMSAAYVETMKMQKDAIRDTLSELEPKLKQTGVAYKTDVLESVSIIDVILSYSEKHGIDFIVMGSRGLGGFKKMLLGSVASGVSQHSKCPVLIVK